MPSMIALTVNFTPSSKYSDGPYTHAQPGAIHRDDADKKFLIFALKLGTESGGSFVASTHPDESINIQDADYVAYKALATVVSNKADEDSRCCAQILKNVADSNPTDYGLWVGTVV